MSAFERIPAELRERDWWVVWRWEVDPDTGKRQKPPYPATSPQGPKHASNANPSDWTTFERAVAVVEAGKADGIGFPLEPPFVGVDLDSELPEADRYAISLALKSYTETSASGDGLHVVLKASLNGRGHHPTGIGVFQTGRFWYCTGEHVTGTPTTIEERQDELDAVLAEFVPVGQDGSDQDGFGLTPQPVDLDDQELFEHAFAAKNGDKFRRLWEGDTSGYPSSSEADLALCSLLAYWTRLDAGRIDRMFRSSGLMRFKWDREDYRERTIKTAIAGTNEVYEPLSRKRVPTSIPPETALIEPRGVRLTLRGSTVI